MLPVSRRQLPSRRSLTALVLKEVSVFAPVALGVGSFAMLVLSMVLADFQRETCSTVFSAFRLRQRSLLSRSSEEERSSCACWVTLTDH